MDHPLERFRRRDLPHWEREGAAYFVTFRLAGSLPAAVAEEWRLERERLRKRELPAAERSRAERVLHSRFDAQLERGEAGPLYLRQPDVAESVVQALEFFRGERYRLPAYVVMPNHVHAVLHPLPRPDGQPWGLDALLHSLKSFTSKEANRILARSGTFWQREYHDHLIRDEDEWAWYVDYTLHNPVQAGLCREPEEWHWSNARVVYGWEACDGENRS